MPGLCHPAPPYDRPHTVTDPSCRVNLRPVRVKLTLEYDGTGFYGWAAQPGLRTVEGVVGDALRSLFSVAENVARAGRADTGVKAGGNAVSAGGGGGPPIERMAEALNTLLPDDVAAVAAEE